MSLSAQVLSALLNVITSKSDWYTKVFNNAIITKWRDEFLSQVDYYTTDYQEEQYKKKQMEDDQREAERQQQLELQRQRAALYPSRIPDIYGQISQPKQHLGIYPGHRYFDADTGTVKTYFPSAVQSQIPPILLTPPSVSAPSVSPPSVSAPSVSASSVSALSVSPPSVSAHSIFAPSVFAPSENEDEHSITFDKYGYIEHKFNREQLELVYNDTFDAAIAYLRSTAQGVIHYKTCEWENRTSCKECRKIAQEVMIEDGEEESTITEEDIDNYVYEMDDCDHIRCSCTSPTSELNDYISYESKRIFSGRTEKELLLAIEEVIANTPKDQVDWHPGSNNMVRDIVHPSMYCYVKGVSRFTDGAVESEDIEELRYQWLPAEVSIQNYSATFTSRINNLDDEKMVTLTAKMFSQFVPRLECILKIPLINSDLQVIVKIGAIHLTKDNPEYNGGSWHLEGQPHEHIVATCISYLKVEGLTDSYLEFRKPTFVNSETVDYPQSDESYTRHHYGLKEHWDGEMNRYLGLIKCDEGASVVFPNTLQHRVQPFRLADGEETATRIILAFFVIDPNHRIISTCDIPDQRSYMSLDDAKYYRERLMLYRKYYVNSLNTVLFEREYSLCEH